MKRFALVGCVVLAAACGGPQGTGGAGSGPAAPPASLYQRLGGIDAIKVVVHDFVANVAADARINARFAKTDLAHLEQMLSDQICAATGGPCTYEGKSMEEAHAGLHITDAEFGALVDDLVKSLDAHKVPAKEKGELLGALGGMKPQIVNR